MPRWTTLLLLAFAAGCASTRVVRLDTGQGAPLVHTPREDVRRVEVDDKAFHKSLAQHARTLPHVERPLEFSRKLFALPTLTGWYRYERKNRRLSPLDAEHALKLQLSPADMELNREYEAWCGRTWAPPPRDCLHLLVSSPLLDGDGKYALAMAIARGEVLGEMKEALGRMVDPEAIAATITGAMTTYLMLWLLPEPISKGVAALMTVGLVAYLGWDLVWKLVEGWRELVETVDRATTFEQIHEAGLKFSTVMGDKGAKALVMLATLAVGNTAAGMAAKMPTLPGAAQAAVVAEAQLNIRYSAEALAQVESVTLEAEGVTVALAPSSLFMTARGGTGGTTGAQPPPLNTGGPGEWVETNESMSESARDYQAQVTKAPKGYAYRVKRGDDEVDFDGFDRGVLLEVKATGYAQWLDKELKFLKIFEGGPKLLAQARRQVRLANGTPIRWIVAEERFAAALRQIFEKEQLPIEVIHVAPTPGRLVQ